MVSCYPVRYDPLVKVYKDLTKQNKAGKGEEVIVALLWSFLNTI